MYSINTDIVNPYFDENLRYKNTLEIIEEAVKEIEKMKEEINYIVIDTYDGG